MSATARTHSDDDLERPNKRVKISSADDAGDAGDSEDELEEVPDTKEEVKVSDLYLDTVCLPQSPSRALEPKSLLD